MDYSPFNTIIDLPISDYFFSNRITFWQIIISLISVFFVSIDTAIEDILTRISHKIGECFMYVGIQAMNLFCPKLSYA